MKSGRQQLVLVAMILACLGLAAAGETHLVGWWGQPTLQDRLAKDPQPTLFPTDTVAMTDSLVDPAAAQAHTLMAQWWSGHGRTHRADDAAFAAWLPTVFPAPENRTLGLEELGRLKATRTPAGFVTANWLGAHGGSDIWMLAADKRSTAVSGARLGDVTGTALRIATELADTLDATWKRAAPYDVRSGLRAHRSSQDHATTVYSYPARPAATSAAGRMVLSRLDPSRAASYAGLERQVDYSHLFTASHFPVDVSGGALLGDMVAEYVLVTRAGITPAQLD